MRSLTRLSQVLLGVVCLASFVGCTQLDWRRPTEWFPLGEDKPQTPANVVAVWSEVLLQHPDRPPTRGFGGRLMFFGPDRDTPLRVDGSLVVYAFDEDNRDPNSGTPDRKYAFTAEQFVGHYSESELGHSYSVWIPWDQAGGPKQDVGLICRFSPTQGPAIISEQTRVALPGNSPPVTTKTAGSMSHIERVKSRTTPVRPVAYQRALPDDQPADEANGDRSGKMKTATIPISPRFGRLTPVAESRRRVNPAPATRQPAHAGTAAKGDLLETDQNVTASTDSRSPEPTSEDSRPGGPRAPTSSPAQPTLGRASWQPLREGRPSLPQSLPPWAIDSGASSTSPIEQPTSNSAEQAQVGRR